MTVPRVVSARIPQIEVLRVIATASVFLFHLWTEIPLTSQIPGLGLLLAQLPAFGAVGVIIFNVLTGFVLAAPYLGVDHGRSIPPALAFFRQRFGRICRHYYPALVLWSAVLVAFPTPTWSLSAFLLAFVTHAGFVHTLHASTFFTIVPAFWWLGLLAQLYLLCPWLLRGLRRFGPGRACGWICVLSWGAWIVLTLLAHQFPSSPLAMVHYLSYFNLPMRLPEFALGMWLASAWNRAVPLVHSQTYTTPTTAPWRTLLLPCLLGLTLLALLPNAIHLPFEAPYNHFYLVAWCLGVTLLILRWPSAIRLGSQPWLLNLAGASYGIYLLHQPLLGYANLGLAALGSPPVRFLVLLVGIALVCYHAAVGLNRLVASLWD